MEEKHVKTASYLLTAQLAGVIIIITLAIISAVTGTPHETNFNNYLLKLDYKSSLSYIHINSVVVYAILTVFSISLVCGMVMGVVYLFLERKKHYFFRLFGVIKVRFKK